MTDFRRPLGDYVQLLLRHDLLADKIGRASCRERV